MRLIFLVEEESMKAVLESVLPKIFPEEIVWQCVPHEGKSDLEKSLPRKLRAMRGMNAHFVVMRDQDSADCREVKARLVDLCKEVDAGRLLIRVVCRELESWFLGDLDAVEQGLGLRGLAKLKEKEKFRDPDAFGSPSQELEQLFVRQKKAARYQKVRGARAIAPFLNLEGNQSRSFQAFVAGLRRLLDASGG